MIIQLNKEYRLQGEPMNIVLERKVLAKNGKKAGQEYWVAEGYYPDSESALNGIFKRLVETTQAEGIQNIIKEIKNAVHDIMEQIELLEK